MNKPRLERLEKAIRPKKAARPRIQIVTRYRDIDGKLTDEDGRPVPVMVMSRPGEPRDADPDRLTITIVDTIVRTPKHAPQDEPEPPDEELPEAIAELEARLRAGGKVKA